MSDQTQTTAVIPSLAALLGHPDFQRGVDEAQECFGEWYEGALSEDQMINEVEENLSRSEYTRSASMMRENHLDHPSYIHHLGFVFGTINKGLAYASLAAQSGPAEPNRLSIASSGGKTFPSLRLCGSGGCSLDM